MVTCYHVEIFLTMGISMISIIGEETSGGGYLCGDALSGRYLQHLVRFYSRSNPGLARSPLLVGALHSLLGLTWLTITTVAPSVWGLTAAREKPKIASILGTPIRSRLPIRTPLSFQQLEEQLALIRRSVNKSINRGCHSCQFLDFLRSPGALQFLYRRNLI